MLIGNPDLYIAYRFIFDRVGVLINLNGLFFIMDKIIML